MYMIHCSLDSYCFYYRELIWTCRGVRHLEHGLHLALCLYSNTEKWRQMNDDRGTITTAITNGCIKMITGYNQDIGKTDCVTKVHWSFLRTLVLEQSKPSTRRSRENFTTQSPSGTTTAIRLWTRATAKVVKRVKKSWKARLPRRHGRANDHKRLHIRMCSSASEWKWGIIDMICKAAPSSICRPSGEHVAQTQQSKNSRKKLDIKKNAPLRLPFTFIRLMRMLLRLLQWRQGQI